MSVSRDIAATWLGPRRVYDRLLARPADEGRVLAWLIGGLGLTFVARLPELSRQAYLSGGEPPLVGLVAGTLLGTLIFAPLLFYLLAGLGWLGARLFGRPVSGWAARAVLFWAVLAAAPAILMHGLVAGFIGPGPALSVVAAVAGAAFLLFWFVGLRVAGADAGTQAA
jgi:hypothetical protein